MVSSINRPKLFGLFFALLLPTTHSISYNQQMATTTTNQRQQQQQQPQPAQQQPLPRFGCQISFCEPYWYQGYYSPYYNNNHVLFRAKLRDFVEKELKPHVEQWIKEGYPKDLHKKAYAAGIQGMLYPPEFGGTRPADFDAFYEVIAVDELSRLGGGNVLGQMAINSIALPPIFNAGSPEMKRKVIPPVVRGDKNICLAISEPYVGSDVANLRTTARRVGDHYIVNGLKKWITGGMIGDYFTTAVRTGPEGSGMSGISPPMLNITQSQLIGVSEWRDMPGISVRKMETQFDNANSTTFVELTDVKVPVSNLIGEENNGFMLLLTNFNHERFVLSTGACRHARICYEEAFKYALERETFGKKLIHHQIIRYKLAEMARQIEALHDNVERVAYQFSKGVSDFAMGGQCALLKVNASKTFEFCAREASQIFGGSSIVKEGKGRIVERLYRDVRATAIPGGSEEILLDFSIRQAVAKATRMQEQEKAGKSKL